MKIIYILLNICLFSLVILFTACPKKTEDIINKQYTIKGKLVYSCDNPTPVINKNVDLEFTSNGVLVNTIGLCKTDSNGIFSFTYDAVGDHILPQFTIGVESGYSYNVVFYNVPINSSLNLGDITTQDNYFGIIKIQTSKTYSSSDTLYYIPGNPFIHNIFIGPFYDGQIIDTFTYSGPLTYQNINNGFLLFWRWGYDIRGNGTYKNTHFDNTKPCFKYNVFSLKID
jgi:hypothetical protein